MLNGRRHDQGIRKRQHRPSAQLRASARDLPRDVCDRRTWQRSERSFDTLCSFFVVCSPGSGENLTYRDSGHDEVCPSCCGLCQKVHGQRGIRDDALQMIDGTDVSRPMRSMPPRALANFPMATRATSAVRPLRTHRFRHESFRRFLLRSLAGSRRNALPT